MIQNKILYCRINRTKPEDKNNMTITVIAFEHADVRGNKLLYLKLSNGLQDVLINIGKKTYDAVTALQNNEPQIPKKTGGK